MHHRDTVTIFNNLNFRKVSSYLLETFYEKFNYEISIYSFFYIFLVVFFFREFLPTENKGSTY